MSLWPVYPDFLLKQTDVDLDLEMPGRTFVSGWTCRIDNSRSAQRPTISDTGVGSARSVDFRPASADDENSYDAIKASCLESGSLWEDPDFPPAQESLFYNEPPSAWPNIDWKRPHVRILSGYYNCDSTAIRLRFGFDSTTTKNEHVHFFVVSRGVVANKKAVAGAYNDVTVYVTVIRMVFTLTDQHWVAYPSIVTLVYPFYTLPK